uniref:GTP-binding protein n=1 Tax=Vannella robusta TaxID=1487602 RepID=A0A7S4MG41_9EUKA|mmetsp:Transcript_21177/g.26843  ORF Transcript_21177/g.26843 Transcript_21177/m.26843 type:complete len:220 (+) Transcript_21177:128-787(+)
MSANSQRKKALFKVIVLGKERSGKTTLTDSYGYNRFVQKKYKCGIGADFLSKEELIDGRLVALQVWDTAGQERFQSLGVSFYRGTDIVLLAFDVTKEESFNEIESWYEEAKVQIEGRGDSMTYLLVGTKVDLPNRVIDYERASALAKKLDLEYREVTATQSESVRNLFVYAATRQLELWDALNPPPVELPKPQQSNSAMKWVALSLIAAAASVIAYKMI